MKDQLQIKEKVKEGMEGLLWQEILKVAVHLPNVAVVFL
jgi:hypothetical protein